MAGTVTEAKEAAEDLRSTAASKKNPISPATTKLLIGVVVGAAVTAAIIGYMDKTTVTTTTTTTPVPAAPTTGPGSQAVYISLTPGVHNTTYSGGTVFIDLPTGAQGWTSVNNQPWTGTAPIQLSDTPASATPYVFSYTDSTGAAQTSTLTITAITPAPAVA